MGFIKTTLIAIIIFFFNSCLYSQKNKQQQGLGKNCVENISFSNKPILLHTFIDQNNFNGLLFKVYGIMDNRYDSSKKIITCDGLLDFKKLPIAIWKEIPARLSVYLNITDQGVYSHYHTESEDRFVIINYSKNTLIIYDYGFLEAYEKVNE